MAARIRDHTPFTIPIAPRVIILPLLAGARSCAAMYGRFAIGLAGGDASFPLSIAAPLAETPGSTGEQLDYEGGLQEKHYWHV